MALSALTNAISVGYNGGELLETEEGSYHREKKLLPEMLRQEDFFIIFEMQVRYLRISCTIAAISVGAET